MTGDLEIVFQEYFEVGCLIISYKRLSKCDKKELQNRLNSSRTYPNSTIFTSHPQEGLD
jgi:hypothetical protein